MAIDPAFGLNNFGKAKLYSESETLANNLLTVLFGKPGSYPSIPSLGMYIQGMLYDSYDDLEEDELKSQLIEQCSYFDEVVTSGEFDIQKTTTKTKDGYEVPFVKIIIPTVIKDVSNRFAVGILMNNGNISYNFQWVD